MASFHTYTLANGKKQWLVAYGNPKKKTPTSKKGFKTKREAQEWWSRQHVAMQKGEYVAPSAGQITVAVAADDYIRAQHDLTPGTLNRYRGIAEGVIAERFGHLPLNALTRPMCRAWVADMVDAEMPAETIHKEYGVLRRILAQAIDDDRLSANPALKVKLPPIAPTEMRFLNLDQLRALANAAGTDAAAIMTLGICGLRMGELVGLRHGDLDRKAGEMHIVRSVTLVNSKHVEGLPKNKKTRRVPLPKSIADMIPTALNPEQLVFPAPGGGYIRHGNWRTRVFDPAVEKVKLFPVEVEKEVDGKVVTVTEYDLHPHELRHTAASLAIAQGANIKKVQSMLGHQRASITLDRYGHLYPGDTSDLADLLDAMLTA